MSCGACSTRFRRCRRRPLGLPPSRRVRPAARRGARGLQRPHGGIHGGVPCARLDVSGEGAERWVTSRRSGAADARREARSSRPATVAGSHRSRFRAPLPTGQPGSGRAWARPWRRRGRAVPLPERVSSLRPVRARPPPLAPHCRARRVTSTRATPRPLVPDMPSDRDMARGLRRWLAKAGPASTGTSSTTESPRPGRRASTTLGRSA